MKIRKFLVLLCIPIILGCKGSIQTDTSEAHLKEPWKYAQNIVESINQPEFNDFDLNIIDFGAVNDGATDCTEAINKAITTCSSEGGGRVVVPAGTFLTGAIHLKSNVNLHLSDSAVLLFDTDKSKYLPVVHTRFEGMECMNYSPFIYAYKQENIAITGKGTLDGQGSDWWSWKGKWSGSVPHAYGPDIPNQKEDNKVLTQMVADHVPVSDRVFGAGHYLRPSFVSPYGCKNIIFEDFTIKGSPMWIIHPILSESIIVRGVKIESLGPNNDGCNPESCENVLIENCYFNTGDDCIAIKSGRNEDGRRAGKPSKNIVIRNCTMVEGHGGIVMGSEISGNVSHVFAEKCIMDSPNLDRAVRIKSNSLRGGVIEHIYVRDLNIIQVKEAVLKINMFYSAEKAKNIPVVRNILLENVKAEKADYGIWIEAYKDYPASNILLKNCNFANVNKNNHIKGALNLTFENVNINGTKL